MKIREAIKAKNRQAQIEEKQKKERINEVRNNGVYTTRLVNDLEKINAIFKDESVKVIRIHVEEKEQAKFMRESYTEIMSEYSVTQIGNMIELRRKVVAF